MNYVILKFIGLVTIQANKLVEAVLVGTDQIITARRYASAVLGVVILSVRLSVTRVTNSKNYRRYFFIPYERQSFWFSATQQWLVGDVPFHLKWAIEVTHPLQKSLTSTDFRL